MRSNVYFLGIPTCGSDLYWHCVPSLGGFRLNSLVLLFDPRVPQAVLAVSASQSALVDLFERIENFFMRLGTYIELPPTAEMTDIIVKVMVEVLLILALVTREVKQAKISEFILGDMPSSFDLSGFFRKIPEKVDRKVGYRGCPAKARQSSTRGKSDGDCARSEGHPWCD